MSQVDPFTDPNGLHSQAEYQNKSACQYNAFSKPMNLSEAQLTCAK